MRIIFFGSGAFGLPTLKKLMREHDVALVVSQPDRPAGRNRAMTPTPIAEFSSKQGLETIKPENVNAPEVIRLIRDIDAEAFVVIAFGQKLRPELLAERFAINLHASLLPKYRGAAPIQWAIINGETETGVSVISLAERMDAGVVYMQLVTRIDPLETAGELHDRLAEMGPHAILDVLKQKTAGELRSWAQNESLASRAPKLAKGDGTVDFNQPADVVRARIHGLTPWPGCTVHVDNRPLKITRVKVVDHHSQHSSVECGTIMDDHTVACAVGGVALLAVQPPGGKMMSLDAYRAGNAFAVGMKLTPL